MMHADKPREQNAEPEPAAASAPLAAVLPSQQIFQGQREIWIEHEGVRYRLRITRRNKLILQK